MTQTPSGHQDGVDASQQSSSPESVESQDPKELSAGQLTQSEDDEPQKWGVSDKARRYIWAGGALVALYFIVDGVIGLVTGPKETPEPVQTTVTQEVSPSASPIAKPETTSFGQSLPDTNRQFALSGFAEAADWPVNGALEAFDLDYVGQVEGAEATVEVLAGQFRSAGHAQAAYAERLGEGATVLGSGDVSVDGTVTGQFTISKDEAGTAFPPAHGDVALPAGTVRAMWTNGTALFEAYGPESEIVNFYNGYGL